MLIYDQPEVINEWVNSHHGGYAPPGYCTALGWVVDNKLVAGVVLFDCNGASCTANIALLGHFPIALLKGTLWYAFNQLKLKRLTFLIKDANIASVNLVTRLGAIHEATLQEADINGDLLIYALFPRNCKIWSRMNGKGQRNSPGGT